jgi:hypothetical protein
MRPALLLLVLSFAVGCGRVGFAHSDANSNGSDADKTPSDAASGTPTFVQLSGALLEQQVDAAATAADAVCTVDPNAEWVALMVTIK